MGLHYRPECGRLPDTLRRAGYNQVRMGVAESRSEQYVSWCDWPQTDGMTKWLIRVAYVIILWACIAYCYNSLGHNTSEIGRSSFPNGASNPVLLQV